MGYRQQLSRRRHIGKDRIGAGVQADDGRPRPSRRRIGPALRTCGKEQDRCGEQRFHIFALIPPKTLRPAVPYPATVW